MALLIRLFSALALGLLGTTAEAALLGRLALTPGGTDYQAYYDTVLEVTWAADANLAATESFGVPRATMFPDFPGTGFIGSNGNMNWPTANMWIAAANTASYLGRSDWRLPTITPVDGSALTYVLSADGSSDVGWNIGAPGSAYPGSTASELAHLYYQTLGNIGARDLAGNEIGGACFESPAYCLTNTGPFLNLTRNEYWTGELYAPAPINAWQFEFYQGLQRGRHYEAYYIGALAVRNGDIAVVPAPGAAWLFGTGLAALGWPRRRVAATDNT